jgi:hypothetical protein
VIRTLDRVATPNPEWSSDAPDPGTSRAPYRLYNIGNQQPVELMHYIEVLEECLGRKAEKNLLPLQPGDKREQMIMDGKYYDYLSQEGYSIFWIIVHSSDSIFGPFNKKEYLQRRKELGVPERLKIDNEDQNY